MSDEMTDEERSEKRREAIVKLMSIIRRAKGDLESLAIHLEGDDPETDVILGRLYEWVAILHQIEEATTLDDMESAEIQAMLLEHGTIDRAQFDHERESWEDYLGPRKGGAEVAQ